MPPPITIKSQVCAANSGSTWSRHACVQLACCVAALVMVLIHQQHTGCQLLLWVQTLHHRLNRSHAQLTFFLRQPRRMITPYAMLMTDGALMVGNGLTGVGFKLAPVCQCLCVVLTTGKHIGGVNARALPIDMGQV